MTDVAAELVDKVRADARSRLLDLLDEVSGRKVLLLDSSIMRPLDMIVKTNDLKDHGVQQWHKLSEQSVQTDCNQMIFLVRCTRLELMDWIAKQILDDEGQGQDRLYVVVLVPRKTEQCAERLRRANVRSNVRIVECGLHFFPFDRDILSMEAPGVFRDFHVQGDPSSSFYVAKALMYLQSQFGVSPSIHSIGGAGKTVVDVMLRLRKEEAVQEASREVMPVAELSQKGVPPVAPRSGKKESPEAAASQGPRISEVIVIDRRVDLFSVLCSQFTYQALIDMVYGVANNQTDIGSAEWAKDKSPQLRLSPEDPFYREIRDLHIDKIGSLLQEKALAIRQTQDEYNAAVKDKDTSLKTSVLTDFVKRIKAAESVRDDVGTHVNLACDVSTVIQSKEYQMDLRLEDEITAQSSQSCLEVLETYIDDQKPFHEVMRLLCLYSLVNNGVKAKQLDTLKKGVMQSYGYKHLLTLCNMERVGMLNYQIGKSSWSGIKQQFNLLVDDSQVMNDISYAYSGYAPLSVRLVQMTRSLPRGWRSCPDALGLLYGPAQQVPQTPDSTVADGRAVAGPALVLVVFVGGVTHGEVAALRRLAELEEGRRRFLIVTTEFVSTKKLVESLECEQVFSQPPLEATRVAAPQDRRGGFGGFWSGAR
uniref:Sec1-like protein n=1 Tax=Alexandrium catenella TaxID=2925 RepID=A0A7S1Q1K1_ALECA